MISIIIPVYQHAKEIGHCLKSIFNQTFKDYEIIVVNDGSTDNISKVLAKYKNKVRTQAGDLFLDGGFCPGADGNHDDHSRHTDDHAQHRQQGA